MRSIGFVHVALAGLVLSASSAVAAQTSQQPAPAQLGLPQKPQAGIKRLWLKDGSFQKITEYKMDGDRVRFYSAERGGWEELPAALVDLPKTETWNKEHAELPPRKKPGADDDDAPAAVAQDDPERPLVKPHLRLDPAAYLLALDSFRNMDELAPMRQEGSEPAPAPPPKPHKPKDGASQPPPLPVVDVRPLVQANPLPASPHRADGHEDIRLRGTRSKNPVHVPDPVFYVRSATATQWAILRVRVDVNRRDRVVTAATEQTLAGTGKDALAVKAEPVAGGVWTRLTPAGSIPIGEYALVQVLPGGRFDEHVWDFAINPTAAENQDAVLPDNAPRR